MSDELLLESSGDQVDREINRMIADGNDRAVLDVLAELPATVKGLRDSRDERFDVGVAVTNACAIAAVGVCRDKPGIVDAALNSLLETYRLGDVTQPVIGSDDDLRLWEETAAAVWVLGALAVKQSDWRTVRAIVDRPPRESDPHFQTWLRHAQVMSARGAQAPDDNLLNTCVDRFAAHAGFACVGLPKSERERFIAGFDQLALLVTAALPGSDPLSFYPSYAKFKVGHVEPLVVALRRPGALRDAIFPDTNDRLREVLREANESALLQAAQYRAHARPWAYEGFQDARTWAFIRTGDMFEDWGPIR